MTETKEQPQEEVKEEVVEEQVAPDIATFLANFPGSPSPSEIEAFKQQYGDVFCSALTDEELFIWRPLRRIEWVDFQKKLRTPPATAQEEPYNELMLEEDIVRTCAVWTSKEDSLDSKAGSISTLSEQILLNSNFLPPAMAANLVIKL